MKITLFTVFIVGIFSRALAGEEVAGSTFTDEKKVTVSVQTNGQLQKKTFIFPKPILEYKVIPFMPGSSIVIAAKPSETGDWYWGIAYLGDGSPEAGTVVSWTTSPHMTRTSFLLNVQRVTRL